MASRHTANPGFSATCTINGKGETFNCRVTGGGRVGRGSTCEANKRLSGKTCIVCTRKSAQMYATGLIHHATHLLVEQVAGHGVVHVEHCWPGAGCGTTVN